LLAGIFSCALSFIGSGIAVAADAPITVTASNWKFAPAEITVHVNQPVTLALASSEGVHGFASSELGIANVMIAPGAAKTVKFTPTKVGTYTIHCTVMCGQGHANMTFVIKVVA
jgi:cytochrome c oxidase subunit 2